MTRYPVPGPSRRNVLVGGLGLGLLGGLSACGGKQASSTSSNKITLATPSEYTQLPIKYGVDHGIFKNEGLDVEYKNVKDAVIGVVTGELDFAFGPTTTFLLTADKGTPLKVISSAFRTKGPYWIIAGPNIGSVKDLKGKTFGFATAGSNIETVARYVLKKNGVDPDDDVKPVFNGVNNQAYGSLETGQVDATIIHQPFAALGEVEGKSHTLARCWDYLPRFHTGSLISGTQTVEKKPDLLKRGLSAYFRSYETAKKDENYPSWLKKQLPDINPKAVDQALKLEDALWENNAAIDMKAIDDSQDVELEAGHQNQRFDASQYIDQSLIPTDFKKPFTYPTGKGEDS